MPDKKPKNSRPKTIGEILGEETKFKSDPVELRQRTGSVPQTLSSGIDTSEYTPYTGTNVNPYTQDINLERAQEQGFFQQAGRSAVQIGAEVLGGSIEGAGYILGLPEMAVDYVKGQEIDLSNSISEFGAKIREESRENFPIYETDPGSFNLLDPGWWFKNGVSIASTLSLAIPAMGVTKGMKLAGQGLKALSGIGKAKKGSMLMKALGKAGPKAEVLTQAILSRHAENLMEAVPAFEEKYQELLDKGIAEEVARKRAAETAATIYKLNSAFLLQDIGTFGLLGKATRALKGGKGAAMPSWKRSLTDSATEGLEEAYQYAVGEEASVQADIAAGVAPPSAFVDRMGDYVNGEMATGAFFGALGNTVFQAVGSRINKLADSKLFEKQVQDELDSKAQELDRELTPEEESQTRDEVAKKWSMKAAQQYEGLQNIDSMLDEEIIQRKSEGKDVSFLTAKKAIGTAINHMNVTGKNIGMIDTLLEMSEDEFNKVMGEDPLVNKQQLQEIKEVVDIIPEIYNENLQRLGKEAAGSVTYREASKKYLSTKMAKKQTQVETQLSQLNNWGRLSDKGESMAKRQVRIAGLKRAIKIQKENKKQDSVEKMEKWLKDEQELLASQKAKESKPDQQLEDEKVISQLQPDLKAAGQNYASVPIMESLSEMYTEDIARIEKEALAGETPAQQQVPDHDKPPQTTFRAGEEIETPMSKANFVPVESANDLKAGDEIVVGNNSTYPQQIWENEDGDLVFGPKGEAVEGQEAPQSYPIENLFLNKKLSIRKKVDKGEAARKAKTDTSDEGMSQPPSKVPDEYDNLPDKSSSSKKTEIRSASWMSIHNPRNRTPEDPDEIARTNWAETTSNIYDGNGQPAYYVEFELGAGVTPDSGAIRAYVVDKQGNRIQENDKDVFYFVHEPTYDQIDGQPNHESIIKAYRTEIIEMVNRGEQPVAPITEKTEGVYRFDGDIKSVMDILGSRSQTPLNPSDITLTVLDKSLNYSDKDGVPAGFDILGKGNPSQVGRVYTITTALNGVPKVLPLERKNIGKQLADIVSMITHDMIIHSKKPGDTVSDTVMAAFEGFEQGKALKRILGGSPTNQEVIDSIVLEGPITERLTKPEKKLFNISLDNKELRFGEKRYKFTEYASDPTVIRDDLVEFLSKRRHNVLRSKLNNPEYNNYLIGQEVLYQTNKLPLLIQPTLKFGHQVESRKDILDEVIDQQDQQEDIPKDSTDTDDNFGQFFQKDFDGKVEGNVKAVANMLRRKFGIDYRIINDLDIRWKGRYDGEIALINIARAGIDTAFHEFAHPIIRQIKNNNPILYHSLVQQMFEDPAARATYRAVKDSYKNFTDEQIIEETIVQMLGKMSALNYKSQSVLQRIWNKIAQYINSILGRSKDLSDIPVNLTIDSLVEMMTDTSFVNVQKNPMLAYEKPFSDMSYSEYNSWLNSIIFGLLNTNDVTDYRDADKLNFENLRLWLTKMATGRPRLQEIITDLYNEDKSVNKDSLWYQAINDKMSKFNIRPNTDDVNTGDVTDENSFAHTPDYFFDGKDKASSFIKMMFSTIPKVEKVQTNGKIVFAKNKHTGMPEFHTFNDIWNVTISTLSNTVESHQDGKPQDLFQKMIGKLQGISHLRPEMSYLVKKFQDMPSWKREKFVATFYKADQNYSVMLYDGQFKIIKNHPTAAETKIKTRWRENLDREWFNKDNEIAQNRVEQIEQKYDKFVDNWKRYYKDWFKKGKPGGPVPNKFTESMRIILSNLGLDFSDKALEYLLTTYEGPKMEAFNYYATEEGLNRIIRGDNGITKLSDNRGDTFIEDQSAARTFIEAESFFNQDLGSLSVFGPQNNTYYNYSNYSMMGKLLDYYKGDPEKINEISNIPFYKNSKWAKPDILENLHITNNMSFKTSNSSGQKMKQLSPVDRLLVDINKTLQGQFSMLARGANSTEFNITGAPVERSFKIKGNRVSLNTEAVDTLAGYLYDEVERIHAAREYINDPDNADKLIDGYHTEVTDADGNTYIPALTSFLGKHFQKTQSDLFDEDGMPIAKSREGFIQEDSVRNLVQSAVRKQVADTLVYMRQNGLEDQQVERFITPDKKDRYDNSNVLGSKLYDYIYNGMVANIEQQKLFASDIAMFESVENMQKRILANGSMGINWYIHDGESEFYNSATIKDVKMDSKVYENYKGVNVGDAQAWVTMDFYVQALKGYGKWSPEYDAALDRIERGVPTQDDLALFMQPMKTVHFERVIEEDLVIPVYDKQTILPLVPNLVNGTSLERLLSNMQKQGIDHVTVESGKKLGRRAPTDAYDVENRQFRETFTLHPIRQSKKYTLLQTEMPTKGAGPKLQGSQQKYNIIADLDPEATNSEGKNMIATIHNIQSAISDNSMIEWTDRFFKDGELDKDALYNEIISLSSSAEIDRNLIDYLQDRLPIEAMPAYNYSLQNSIMSMIKNKGATIDHNHAIKGIQTSMVGFDQIIEGEKNDVTWLTEDRDLKPPRMEGGELKPGQMLVSHKIIKQYGLNTRTKADRDLIREVLSGIDYRIPNQSISNIGHFEIVGVLPEYMGDTVVVYGELNEKSGSDNDGDKVDLMLYNYTGKERPTKVRYWTEDTGDAAWKQVYQYRKDELGEDLPSFEDFKKKYPNLLSANSMDGIQNYLLDTYKEILSMPEAFKRSTSKLESSLLEDLITSHQNYQGREIHDFEVVSPLYQVKVRDSFLNANSSVGQVSNHIIDHVKSQFKNIYAVSVKGKPMKVRGVDTNTTTAMYKGKQVEATLFDEEMTTDGKRISEILSMFMNAQVDAEKNDYAPRGNFTTETNSVAFTMVRAGVPLKDIVDIIGSDIVRDFTNLQRSQKNVFIRNDEDALASVLEKHDIDQEDFWKLDDNPLRIYLDFKGISADMSASIQLTRYSVIGAGPSFASAVAYEKFRDQPIRRLKNVDNKFSIEGGASMEETYYKNTVLKVRELFEDQSVAFGDQFSDVLDALYDQTPFNPVDLQFGNVDATENVYFDFYSFMYSAAFQDVNREDLIKGNNTVADRVRTYKDQENPLIKFLVPVTVGQYEMLETSNATKIDVDMSNELSEAWEDLYREDKDLALDLARYAYFQSGFKRNFHSIHEFIPKIINNELNIVGQFQQQQASDKTLADFTNQYIRHRWRDSNIVPYVGRKQFVGENQVKPKAPVLSNTGKLVRFIRVSKTQPDGHSVSRLYELVDRDENLYQLTPTLGYDKSGRKYHEYDVNMVEETPIFSKIPYPEVSEIQSSPNLSDQTEKTDDWKDEENNDDNPLCPF